MLSEDRPRSSSSDGAFRLNNAVNEAIRAAHTVVQQHNVAFDEAVINTPASGLAVEERYVFGQLLDQYTEAIGARRYALDSRSGTTLRRPSASGAFQLTGRLDLVVRTADDCDDATLAVHRVQMSAPPDNTTWADAGAAVLLSVGRLRTVRIWKGGVDERIVDETDIRRFRDELHDAIDTARARPDETNPGWWCTNCRVALRCPALASDPFERVLSRLADAT